MKSFFIFLKGFENDMVLEAAVTGGCSHIVRFDKQDFAGAERFGVRIVTPQSFLAKIGEKS